MVKALKGRAVFWFSSFMAASKAAKVFSDKWQPFTSPTGLFCKSGPGRSQIGAGAGVVVPSLCEKKRMKTSETSVWVKYVEFSQLQDGEVSKNHPKGHQRTYIYGLFLYAKLQETVGRKVCRCRSWGRMSTASLLTTCFDTFHGKDLEKSSVFTIQLEDT